MELVLATKNRGKIKEIVEILDIPGLELKTYLDFTSWPHLEETGRTFEENALIKAEGLCEHLGLPALAEDSGLSVDHLGGRPGVFSSRYAGPECDPEKNIDRLLRELDGVPKEKRTAGFVCVAALVLPGGGGCVSKGSCRGYVLKEKRGGGGFGYDPVFVPEGYNRSMAELSLDEKNLISHRGKAIRGMKSVIEDMVGK